MPSVIDVIHKQISSVFSVQHDQFFCLTVPGTVLDRRSYAFDVDGAKPAHVREAESRLCNRLYDVSQLAAAPNGRRLSSQYLTALSVLIPRFDLGMAKMKNELRELLQSRPNYQLEDGTTYKGTLQELYFKLYQDYVKKVEEWDDLKARKLDELHNDPRWRDDKARQDQYMSWFEDEAQGHLLAIDALASKVLTLFSPADMNAILAALEAGPGGELEEARRAVLDTRQPSPLGGYVYPVSLSPDDWSDALLSEKSEVDLLDAPEYVAAKLQARREALRASLSQLRTMIAGGKPSDVKTAMDALAQAQSDYDTSQAESLKTYGANGVLALELYLHLPAKNADGTAKGKPGLTAQLGKLDAANPKSKATALQASNLQGLTDANFTALLTGQEKVIDNQRKYLDSARKLATAGEHLARSQAQNLPNLQPLIDRLQQQLQDVDLLQSQLATAILKPAPAALPALQQSQAPAPMAERSGGSDRFMEVTIFSTASEMTSSSDIHSSASSSGWSVGLFFGSASGSSSSAAGSSEMDGLSKDMAIEIGMKVMKVEIEREWFDPGVFGLTRDLDRIGDARVSHGPVNFADDAAAKQANTSILPCFPVAFVVAKDITIRFQCDEAKAHSIKTVADRHAAVGGGFLCFSTSSSSASHDEHSLATSGTDSKTVAIHIRAPQIIGWFLEFIAEDISTPIQTGDAAAGMLAYVKAVRDGMQARTDTVAAPVAAR